MTDTLWGWVSLFCLCVSQRVTAGDLANCRILEKALQVSGSPNEYDVTLFRPYAMIVSPDSPFSAFLNSAEVQAALHVTDTRLAGAATTLKRWQVGPPLLYPLMFADSADDD